jgi:hypothetical protein
MLHLIKLAVGIRDVAHLEAVQAERLERNPPLRHLTRHAPKRAAEILDGGSIYWVIGGVVQARQRIVDILSDTYEDGSACCALVLDPVIVRVEARSKKAFQGWRYFAPGDAPPDIGAGVAVGEMPDEMRRALAALALL